MFRYSVPTKHCSKYSHWYMFNNITVLSRQLLLLILLLFFVLVWFYQIVTPAVKGLHLDISVLQISQQ